MVKEYKSGHYYCIKWAYEESLIVIVSFGCSGEVFSVKELASSSTLYENNIPFEPQWVNKHAIVSEEVNKNDLPLYVGWKFVSPELAEIIKRLEND
jgi:hypothetical protein